MEYSSLPAETPADDPPAICAAKSTFSPAVSGVSSFASGLFSVVAASPAFFTFWVGSAVGAALWAAAAVGDGVGSALCVGTAVGAAVGSAVGAGVWVAVTVAVFPPGFQPRRPGAFPPHQNTNASTAKTSAPTIILFLCFFINKLLYSSFAQVSMLNSICAISARVIACFGLSSISSSGKISWSQQKASAPIAQSDAFT